MGQEIAFKELVSQIPSVGLEWHKQRLIDNTKANLKRIAIDESINDISKKILNEKDEREYLYPIGKRYLIISAGPSLYRQKSLEKIKDFDGVIVCADGAYIQCLRHGIRPHFVVTIDPHPTRIVRWFGDPELEKNQAEDDYFQRQDLDISFRENSLKINQENIHLVDEFFPQAATIIASCSPENVVRRAKNRYWFVPLVDNPEEPNSLTRQMADLTGLPAMNTGGTVGNTCWVFAHTILKSPDIACVGMDYGYYIDTSLEQTQEWMMLKDKENPEQYFPIVGGYWGECRTSPTYAWYKQNLIDLLKAGEGHLTNCTGGGYLAGFRIDFMDLEKWLNA